MAIGAGHVTRCLTLAAALRERGANVGFVCREDPGHLCDLVEQRGFAVTRLPATRDLGMSGDAGAVEAFRTSFWRDDADRSRAAIIAAGARPDWLVVDSYPIDRRWEQALRESADRIMVVDDLADRAHDCDLLLDQNLVAGMESRYADRIPPASTALLGPAYALLQPEYAALRDRVRPREGPVRRILIFMSGADADNVTGRALAAFLSLRRPDIDADVVATTASPHLPWLRSRSTGHANVHLHAGVASLAPLMAGADLAVGAAGGTTWERLCLALPALVVTLAEHQRPVARELQQRGLIRWLGHHDEVGEMAIGQALNELFQCGLNGAWSRGCGAVVDGLGASRACDALSLVHTAR